MNFKLSPSDLTFLYEGCQRCFWLKVKKGIVQPSIPIPGIFSKIAGLLKTFYSGKLQDGGQVLSVIFETYSISILPLVILISTSLNTIARSSTIPLAGHLSKSVILSGKKVAGHLNASISST